MKSLLLCLSLACAAPAAALQATEPDSYPNAHLLVDSSWVTEHHAEPGVVLVDVREAAAYAAGHLPGAVSLPRAVSFDPKRSGDRVPKALFEKELSARGIAPTDHVVLYDGGRSTEAPRVFWTFESFGHAKVSVLDGGSARWVAEGNELVKEAPERTPTTYAFGKAPERMSTKDEILAGLDTPETCVVIDARSAGEYAEAHVPGALHIEWLENFTDEEVPVFLPAKELAQLYAERGVVKDHRAHAY